jgi:tetratricopeptide (TPR) repeat protein
MLIRGKHGAGRRFRFETNPVCRRVAAAVVAAALAALPVASSAQEEAEPDAGAPSARRVSSMRESVYKELAKAQEKVDEEKYSEALEALDKLKGAELNGYERSQLWNLYAYIYHTQERYPQAIDAFEKLLGEAEVDPALESGALYGLALLYLSTEQWSKSIETMNRWLARGDAERPQAHEILANAYYQLGEYRKAIPPMRKAIELKRAAGQVVDEQSYLLLRSAYTEIKEYGRAAEVLENLIALHPGEKYWLQLAATYGEAGDEEKQLSVMELAYLQGFLDTEPELLTLVSLQLQNGLPFQAGKLLEKGLEEGSLDSNLKNLRLLSQAWTLAHEDRRAIPALTKAAKLAQDGELELVLAQSYVNLEDWESAAEAARAAIRKGGLDRPDQAQVLLGQVLYYQGAFEESRQAFERAQSDARSRKLAAQWLTYIDKELDRQRQLRAALEE